MHWPTGSLRSGCGLGWGRSKLFEQSSLDAETWLWQDRTDGRRAIKSGTCQNESPFDYHELKWQDRRMKTCACLRSLMYIQCNDFWELRMQLIWKPTRLPIPYQSSRLAPPYRARHCLRYGTRVETPPPAPNTRLLSALRWCSLALAPAEMHSNW